MFSFVIILISVGLLCIVKGLFNIYKDYRYKRNAHRCIGIVTNKEFDEEKKKFKLTVEFEYDGKTHTRSCYGENYFVGGEYPLYYSEAGEKILMLHDAKKRLSTNIKINLAGIFVLVIAYAIFMRHYEAMSYRRVVHIVGLSLIAVACISAGIGNFMKCLRIIRSYTLNRTTATVIDIIPQQVFDIYGGEATVYYLLYEFEVDGEKKQVKSATGSSKNITKYHKGDTEIIYYDIASGIADKGERMRMQMLASFLMAIIGMALAILILNVFLDFLKVKFII